MSELIDNRAQRIATLKDVIRGLHEGQPLPMVKARLAGLVRQCDASEIACMEQELIREGVPVQKITSMCDLHAQVVRDTLPAAVPEVPPGHPVDTFRRENGALREQAAALRGALESWMDGTGGRGAAKAQLGLLMDVDKHYRRKEHLLFPFLEKRGISGPSTVMWAKDDEVRSRLAELGGILDEGGPETDFERQYGAKVAAEQAIAGLEEMIFKEERILLPMALQSLGEEEWGQIAAQSPEIGYCLVDEVPAWRGAAAVAGAATPPPAGSVVLPTGALTLAELEALFAALPVDVTFVDADDRVRYFSEGRNRVFHRAKAVLGRKVQNCHPPSSVGTVERILADFRAGTEDVAEFWLQMRGRFVHVRYFALRDGAGAYTGTLEVTQDLTRERALEGERRLLQYD